MKKLLIAIAIGIVLTVASFAAAGFIGGACHCVTPTTVMFPYASIVFGTTSWDFIGLVLIALQYPAYTVILVCLRGIKQRALSVAILLVGHIVAVFVGLKVFHH